MQKTNTSNAAVMDPEEQDMYDSMLNNGMSEENMETKLTRQCLYSSVPVHSSSGNFMFQV